MFLMTAIQFVPTMAGKWQHISSNRLPRRHTKCCVPTENASTSQAAWFLSLQVSEFKYLSQSGSGRSMVPAAGKKKVFCIQKYPIYFTR